MMEPSTSGTSSGMCTTSLAGTATNSAYPPSMWLPSIWLFSQMFSRPDRQSVQCPQESTAGMSTRAPAARLVTPAPTSATVPATSCPRMIGGGLKVGVPWSM